MSRNRPVDDISIRNAVASDFSIIKSLYGQLAPDVSNVDRDFPAILSDANSICLVLEEQDQPVGMVICYVRSSLSSGKMMIIDEIVINHNHRGRGYGRMLMEHCINLAKARGLDCIELTCSLAKPELHRFYEGMGFKHRMRLYSLFLGDE